MGVGWADCAPAGGFSGSARLRVDKRPAGGYDAALTSLGGVALTTDMARPVRRLALIKGKAVKIRRGCATVSEGCRVRRFPRARKPSRAEGALLLR